MKRQNWLLKSMATALLAAAGMCCAPVANAQPSPANADAMYNGYLSAYLVTVDSTHAFIATSITDRTHDYMCTRRTKSPVLKMRTTEPKTLRAKP